MDGHGTVVTFGTSGFTACLISVDGPDMSRESIDETCMSTTTAMDYDPAALYDGGTMTMTIAHSIDDLPPIDGANETVTINWAGQGAGNIWSFTGHVVSYSGGAAIGERMEATMGVKVSGAITIT